MTTFALLTYDTPNLGDDVQSLAARQHLPRVDALVNRDRLGEARRLGDDVRCILNGWFLHEPYDWPPPANVRPLLISFHIQRHARRALLAPPALRYYERHGPVGCRDEQTLVALERAGVDAYYSGCLTLTLQHRPAEHHGRIVFCDPFGHDERYHFHQPGEAEFERRMAVFPDAVRDRAEFVTHQIPTTLSPEERLARAEQVLALYGGADAVVTCRIHCALPCLAMGVPVLFLEPRKSSEIRLFGALHWWRRLTRRSGHTDRRFPGLVDLMHSRHVDAIAAGPLGYDLLEPPANPADISDLADALRDRCARYVATAAEPAEV